MPYRFKPKESLEENVRRIACEQVDRALALPTPDIARQVHETRKCLKRARALLRLVRDGLPRALARELNANLRETGRILSGRRDQDVRNTTLAALGEGARPALAAALRKAEAKNRAAPAQIAQADETRVEGDATDLLAAARVRLDAVRSALAELSVRGDAETIRAGLERTHKAARLALDDIAHRPHDEAYHELRKVVQAHWRQSVLLSAAWPQMMQMRARIAQDLSQQLGLEHDLSMLAGWAEGLAGAGISARDAALIVKACRERQQQLRVQAVLEAQRLFSAKPRRFAREIIDLWELAVVQRREARRAARTDAAEVASQAKAETSPRGAQSG